MIWGVANMSQYRRTIAEIKNDFDNAFRQDAFIMKRGEPLNLPDGVDYIFKWNGGWYVVVAVQMIGQLVIDDNIIR